LSEAAITLAIPYHRGPAYLRHAVESVLAQDDDAWQLAIRDDGERGEASAVIAQLGLADHPRVRCVSNAANLGMVANWNVCLDDASTPLAMLLHADDALEPGYVRSMRALAAAHPSATAFFCEARIIDATGRERFSFADWIKRFYLPAEARRGGSFALRGESALRAIMAGNFIMCPTLCFRLEALGARRFDASHRQVQDLELTSRLLMDGDTLVGTRETAYVYRRHDEGATAQQSESLLRFREELALFDRVAERASEIGWSGAARVARRKTIIRLHLGYRALGDLARLRAGRALRELRLAVGGGRPPA
jgi:glycosyltransferase involved in cell wall biosynthesis